MSTTTADVEIAGSSAEERQERLATATAGLRLRASRIRLDKWLQYAGGILLPSGAILIIVGWYGTSHTTRVWEQLPYVVSGGLLGTGFIFAGGFCYFAYWLTTIVEDGRLQAAEARDAAERTASALERIEELLRSGPTGSSAVLIGTGLVATATGSMIHRPDCSMVTGKDDLRSVRADEPGMRPCLVCNPV